ncbi:D-inositol-3-phosphate glycosyltransferase [bioreactor metagenome]|uniref:D-inositol-3-phosphate glycosyltransferase n=1 Tax=bioreactor metagenome TaxID=1076179 RepID=A0A644YMH9_9ZZZZ
MWKYSYLREVIKIAKKGVFQRNKKRVLFYTSSLASGGAERQLIYTALAAEERGYGVRIVVDYPICHYDYMLDESRMEVLCTNTTGYTPLKRFFLLSKIIREFRPDVVHSFLSLRNLWAVTLGKIYGVPVKIASIRSTFTEGFSGLRWYKNHADWIVLNSQLAADIAREKYGVDREKIKVIYNAIDFKRFNNARLLPELKRELGLDQTVRLGVTPARFHREKNLPGLVVALHRLNEEGFLENIHFLIVGKTTDSLLEKKVKEQINSNGLSNKISILGFRKDIPEILKTCDFMVLPSFSEGFPNVVLEAMAAGCFVIATPTGGTPELVKDGENGLLSKSTTPVDIAHAIKNYLNMDRSKNDCIRSNAVKWATRYDKELAFETLFTLYG